MKKYKYDRISCSTSIKFKFLEEKKKLSKRMHKKLTNNDALIMWIHNFNAYTPQKFKDLIAAEEDHKRIESDQRLQIKTLEKRIKTNEEQIKVYIDREQRRLSAKNLEPSRKFLHVPKSNELNDLQRC